MDCTDIKAMLSGLIDGEVDGTTRHDAERHLAGCESCRQMVDEAERLDERVAAEAGSYQAGGWSKELEGAVLSRTVYADGRRATGQWTTWLGWLAAAASLALALTIWALERQGSPPVIIPGSAVQVRSSPRVFPATYRPGPELRSSVYDGELPVETLIGPVLTREDAEALDATSQVLALLPEMATDLEHVRGIIEYDELLSRLAEARQRLEPGDGPAVLAAESILAAIVAGPLSAERLAELREMVDRLKLVARLGAISARGPSGSSL
ncbi:MAG: zf-HC2 domain-containing protein [Planctomycetota bacterium]|jgi:hypothetical protein